MEAGRHGSHQVGPEYCSASQLREEGWALGELKKASYDCAALREVGVVVIYCYIYSKPGYGDIS